MAPDKKIDGERGRGRPKTKGKRTHSNISIESNKSNTNKLRTVRLPEPEPISIARCSRSPDRISEKFLDEVPSNNVNYTGEDELINNVKRKSSIDALSVKRPRYVDDKEFDEFYHRRSYLIGIKDLPKFSGHVGEDVCLWIEQSRFFLKSLPHSEKEKIEIVSLSLSGDARNIIVGRRDVATVEDIYGIIRNAFKPQTSPIHQLFNTKQKPEEPISLFGARLKANLQASGIASDTIHYEDILLRLFLSQIKPELARRLNIWAPDSFEKALAAAIRYEEESFNHKREKLMNLETKRVREEKTSTGSNENLNELVALMKEQLNKPQYRTSKWINKNKPNWKIVKCFFCKKEGHSFRKCRQATPKDIQQIEQNIGKYFDELNKESAIPLNLQPRTEKNSPLIREHQVEFKN